MVRDFARLQLFLRAPINFHSARSPFFFLSHARDKLFNSEKRWRHFRTQESWLPIPQPGSASTCYAPFFPSPPFWASLRRKRVFLMRLPLTLVMIPGARPSHVTAPAAILRIATSRKRILRPQLCVQAILLLNILSERGNPRLARTSVKWYSVRSRADRVYTRFTHTWFINILNYLHPISNDNRRPDVVLRSILHISRIILSPR